MSAEEFLRPDGVVDRSRVGLLFIESYRELPLLSWPRVDRLICRNGRVNLLFRIHMPEWLNG